MDETTVTDQAGAAASTVTTRAVEADTAELVDELLVEEISIDGMCGVY